ncbi:MAG: hypothetical protein PHV68_07395 [Candidatus Gastranaerophilales bacterium]|nr:hypothetical protein [Candidatus Gastranaerophilales bacterium]
MIFCWGAFVDLDMIDNKNELIKEKKKIQRQCISLECETEQLKCLIERLNTISIVKESELINFYNTGISVIDKLAFVEKKKNHLEKCIEKLKTQMKNIDNNL